MKKLKKNKQHSEGFTLIELLAIIVILSLVLSLSFVVIRNIINDAREKTYKVTVNNIEKMASSYAVENYMKHEWLLNSVDSGKQYFCVSVKDLIDTGFLSNDVLGSSIGNDKLVNEKNYIYLERDKKTNVITKNLLIDYYDDNYSSYCNDYNTGVHIEFIEEPRGWAREKKLIIKYKIFNLINNISDYKYKYSFENANKFIDWSDFDDLLVTEEISNIVTNGVVKTYVKSTDLSSNVEYEIKDIDRNAPEIHLSLDNKSVEESKNIGKVYAKKRELLISLTDNQSGLKKGVYTIKYEWSIEEKTCDELANSIEISVNDNSLKTVSKSIDISGKTGIGKFYACGENISDTAGNIRVNKIESLDLYLDNIKPVISIGNYNGDKIVYKKVIIPIIVNDKDSGIKENSFNIKDIVVMIGQTRITDGLTLSKDNNIYNLKIENSTLNGEISLKIDKDNILDNVLNGNDDVILNTDVSFSNVYTVSYNANGGIGAPISQIKTHGVDLKLSTIKPTRSGYTFLGWSTSSTATNVMYSAGDNYTNNMETTLYAVWRLASPVNNYGCANIKVGSEYLFTYTGNCSVHNDGNGNWRIKFLTSGDLIWKIPINVDVFLVGGGGGGAGGVEDTYSGGGGGGGYANTIKDVSIIEKKKYYINIGLGGSANGGKGGTSSAFEHSVLGGNGGSRTIGGVGGNNGGSGGSRYGAGSGGSSGNISTREFGETNGTWYAGGGGGGGGGGVYLGNDGEAGLPYRPGGTAGTGGGGRGGDSIYNNYNGSAGGENTGGGGGGGTEYYGRGKTGSAGGSGIVIIRNKR